jgi:acyl carrier protein
MTEMAEVRSFVRTTWCRYLGVDEIDDDADFFALGGDSLAAISMLMDVVEELSPGIDIEKILLEKLTPLNVCDVVVSSVGSSGAAHQLGE